MHRRDLLGGLAFFVLGGAVSLEAVRLGVGSPARPGPGFLPLILGALLVLSSVALVIVSRRRLPTADAPRAQGEPFTRESRVLFVSAALVAYALLFEVLGYVVSTFALLSLLFVAVWPNRKRRALTSAAIALVCTYVLFVVWLKVRLPAGVLSGWG